ncbi:anti-sigma factor [Stagnihabitans tardus]|uniref:Anti-sigma factor n=1 Tax=Stagnihabitans tardus TaxID=2699202 RepID=A0AAE4Y912_9RHOB|nr:anti-sigma factor [Stagnihabitans tardus]NBZ87429.1 anti-sigma factor [Stagnihabitans tardus]
MTATDQDDDLLAAEYVLGTLPLEDRALAERRLREPGFAARVAEWERRLSGLNPEFAEAPAPDLMPAIEARLFPQAPAPSRWQGLRLWGASALSALAVVAYLALTPVQPDFTAVILAETGGLEYDAQLSGRQMVVSLKSGSLPGPDQAHELWLIVGDAAPVSLGLLGAETRIAFAAPPEGAILAVSLEPAGGSPTGQPTGPVLALGALKRS